MDISAVRTASDVNGSVYGAQTTFRSPAATQVVAGNSRDVVDRSVSVANSDEKKLDEQQKVQKVTDDMNNVMESLDVNMRFKIHQKTNELMVQFLDQSTNRVIKEFPSEAFLNTVAAIRDYVGIILDEQI